MKDNKPVKGRQVVLLIVSLLLVLLIFKLPANRDWFKARPLNYYEEIKESSKQEITTEMRREMRYGQQYALANMLAQQFKSEKDVTVLFEPNNYYRSMQIPMIVPEPILFYYYTSGQMKAVWLDSKDLYKAKYFVRITKELQLEIVPLPNKAAIDTVVEAYKNFKPTL